VSLRGRNQRHKSKRELYVRDREETFQLYNIHSQNTLVKVYIYIRYRVALPSDATPHHVILWPSPQQPLKRRPRCGGKMMMLDSLKATSKRPMKNIIIN